MRTIDLIYVDTKNLRLQVNSNSAFSTDFDVDSQRDLHMGQVGLVIVCEVGYLGRLPQRKLEDKQA